MRRFHLFEIEDAPWCPRATRDGATDYLQFVLDRFNPYARVAPLLREGIERSGATRVVDLGSGAGGPWLRLHESVIDGGPVEVLLTDKYPNAGAFRRLAVRTGGAIRFHPRPVDARRVSEDLLGFRTLFSSFHHFRPDDAVEILADAVSRRQGIAVVEATRRSLLGIAFVLTMPLVALAVTPFIRPFRWSRLLLTYVLPLIPFVVLFDGVVSCLRTYTEDELRAMTARFDCSGYEWTIGRARAPLSGVPVTYLMGVPPAPTQCPSARQPLTARTRRGPGRVRQWTTSRSTRA